MVWLYAQGYSDPRWMTFNQARGAGYKIKKGSRGTSIEYWQFKSKTPIKDKSGKTVRDSNGDKVYLEAKLRKPLVARFTVFNGEQIEGLPEIEPKAVVPDWERDKRVEGILSKSGADIKHVGGNRAYYSLFRDQIVLPKPSQFVSSAKYYAVALHELGHWTGHESRLNRDMSGGFGSEQYAKEELRAEIFSFMLGGELRLGHDPGQHMAYVDHWIKALENDPREIFRASADAAKIQKYVLDLEINKERTAVPEVTASREADRSLTI